MAFEIFNPPVPPSEPLPRPTTVRVLENDFADGYAQSAPDGLNHIKRTCQPSWPRLKRLQSDEIEAFLRARAGGPFRWMYPGESDYSQWKCKSWTATDLRNDRVNLVAQFEQDFSL